MFFKCSGALALALRGAFFLSKHFLAFAGVKVEHLVEHLQSCRVSIYISHSLKAKPGWRNWQTRQT